MPRFQTKQFSMFQANFTGREGYLLARIQKLDAHICHSLGQICVFNACFTLIGSWEG